jgi:hypothetical protein
MEARLQLSKTHALEISMDHSLAVDVDQPRSDAFQLEDHAIVNGARTAKLWTENPQARAGLRPDVPSRSR